MTTSDLDQSLEQAKTYLTKIRSSFQRLSILFQPEGDHYLIPAQYKGAAKSLRQIKGCLHSILSCINSTPSISSSDQLSIINIKLLIDKHLNDKLIPLIESENATYHQTIRRELLWLELQLNEIHRCLFGMEPLLPPISLDKKKRPNPGIPVNWRNMLIDTLNGLSVANTYSGRTSLLHGIPDGGLQRDPGNTLLDLTLIIDQLELIGPLDSGQWPLLLLIDNALPFAQGFQTPMRNLSKVKQTLKVRYKVR